MRPILWLLALSLLPNLLAADATSTTPPEPSPNPQSEDKLAEAAISGLWVASDYFWHRGQYQDCVDLYDKIVLIDPTQVEAYTLAAWLLWSKERDPEAVARYKACTEANPEAWEGWYEWGYFYHYNYKNDPQAALPLIQKAAQLPDHPVNVEKSLAHVLEKLGRVDEAIAIWEKLAPDHPEDPAIQQNLERLRQVKRGADLPPPSTA